MSEENKSDPVPHADSPRELRDMLVRHIQVGEGAWCKSTSPDFAKAGEIVTCRKCIALMNAVSETSENLSDGAVLADAHESVRARFKPEAATTFVVLRWRGRVQPLLAGGFPHESSPRSFNP